MALDISRHLQISRTYNIRTRLDSSREGATRRELDSLNREPHARSWELATYFDHEHDSQGVRSVWLQMGAEIADAEGVPRVRQPEMERAAASRAEERRQPVTILTPNADATRSAQEIGSLFTSCSHTRITVHPVAASLALFLSSRSRLSIRFSDQ